ncbi:MAG: hypothetical protein LBV08_08490, partial [Clostridiales bacterium]|nr:hypothetical protein [Clostridiales bacterium]
ISEVVDEIIGLYSDQFLSKSPISESQSHITSENVFIGYIGLAKALQGRDNWRELLKQAMERINFHVDNPDWQELRITSQRSSINKNRIMKIADYFMNKLGE